MQPNSIKSLNFLGGDSPKPISRGERRALPPFSCSPPPLHPLLVPSALNQRLWLWIQYHKYPGYAPVDDNTSLVDGVPLKGYVAS